MTGRSTAYHPRIGDAELARRLESAGAVLIEGPRACGKTETARQAAASEVLLDVDENEVDAVVEDRRGDWCAFEVKLGAGQVDAAASTLLKLRDRVDAEKSAPPRALGMIVSSATAIAARTAWRSSPSPR